MAIPVPAPVCAGLAPAAAVDAALVAIPVLGDADADTLADLPALDAATSGAIARARSSGEFRGKRRETFETSVIGDGWRASRVLLVGAPPGAEPLTARLREAAAVAIRIARARRAPRLAFVCRGEGSAPELTQAVGEGLVIGGFTDNRYKSKPDADGAAPACDVVWPEGDGGPGAPEAIARGVKIGVGRQRRPRAGEPAVQPAEARGVRGTCGRSGRGGRDRYGSARRNGDPEARYGAAAGRGARGATRLPGCWSCATSRRTRLRARCWD